MSVRAVHAALCERYPRYAQIANLREWLTSDGGSLEYVALAGVPTLRQIEWVMARFRELAT